LGWTRFGAARSTLGTRSCAFPALQKLVTVNRQLVYAKIVEFNVSAAFGVMQVDTPSDTNCMTLDHRESSPFFGNENQKRLTIIYT
jgi:hypothetical protein